jgi:hypothetical protein
MRVKYCTVWPNDPTKNAGKGYGSSVNLSGTTLVNGEWVDASLYAKGKTWQVLKALQTAGVITANDKAWDDPAEKVTVPVNVDGVSRTFVYQKKHGDAYANFFVTDSAVPATPAPKQDHAVGDLPDDPASAYRSETASDKANTIVDKYRKLYESNAAWLAKVAGQGEFPYDAAALNAITFSMFATLKDRGLV